MTSLIEIFKKHQRSGSSRFKQLFRNEMQMRCGEIAQSIKDGEVALEKEFGKVSKNYIYDALKKTFLKDNSQFVLAKLDLMKRLDESTDSPPMKAKGTLTANEAPSSHNDESAKTRVRKSNSTLASEAMIIAHGRHGKQTTQGKSKKQLSRAKKKKRKSTRGTYDSDEELIRNTT
mmetsp:Transcript_28049/g.41317  ORF Transcript_28049/g.41317 Transcript_28049/m.41317 type:complete len:175 (-) Transcript_28049:151-675(-)